MPAASTRTEKVAVMPSALTWPGSRAVEAARPAAATASPSTQPTKASTRLSVRSSRVTRQRLAPSAMRTASSRCRVDRRVTCRLETLAQTNSSMNAIAAASNLAAGRSDSVSTSAHGTTVRRQPAYSRNWEP